MIAGRYIKGKPVFRVPTSGGGFTMVEVMVSIGIVASVALAILALLTSAGTSASDIKDSATARRAANTVRQWIETSDFDSLYAEMRADREITLVTYEYRIGDGTRSDGTPNPDANPDDGSGTESATAIRRLDDSNVPTDLDAVDQSAFLCRITLLSLVEDSAPALPDPNDYELASLPLRVEMFRVPPVLEIVQRGVPRRRPTFSFQTHVFR